MGSTEPPIGLPEHGASTGRARSAQRLAPTFGEALVALPAARLLQEGLTRSGHLHLGYFEAAGDSLPRAQDRLVQRALRHLPRASRVVDVGCGLGGSVALLTMAGHQVVGVDPCERSIAYARARVRSVRAHLMAGTLESLAVRARGARFDALLLTEVLPHLGPPKRVFALLRTLLRPGAVVIVHDVVRNPDSRDAGPDDAFHARGALRAEADVTGFDLVEGRETTHRVTPSIPRMARLLDERLPGLLEAFESRADELRRAADELRERLRRLEAGFMQQELSHETTVLRCSARFTTESVVLRGAGRSVARRPRV